MCKNEIAESFFRTSTGIPSGPRALFLLASLTAFFTSKIEIYSFIPVSTYSNSGADLGLRYYQITDYAACYITH